MTHELINKEWKVHNHGLVRVVDLMGSDQSIVQMARCSYGEGTKTVNEDKGLIRYLMRHRHCYLPHMEVLTVEGWKRWDECSDKETFLVPNPVTGAYQKETLPVVSFDCEEEIHGFSNNRMSYEVTSGHRMWFKHAEKESYEVYKVEDMPLWGNFDPSFNYKLHSDQGVPNPLYQLVGFYLGDGFSCNNDYVSFHLKKERKINYLKSILTSLGKEFHIREGDTTVISFNAPELLEIINLKLRSSEKEFCLEKLNSLLDTELLGLYNGLLNSDGSIDTERENRVSFSSNSSNLIKLWELLSAIFGRDSHRRATGGAKCQQSVAYSTCSRTSLESRKQYHYKRFYEGKVYCSTTSTGLLMVRGSPDSFGFVCGNTSPFEGCVLKLHLKMPIFIARQWVRHRTASLNEYSARYSEVRDEFYIPEENYVQLQSKANKQGSELDGLDASKQSAFKEGTEITARETYERYQNDLGMGVAREMARINLPLSTYTEMYWQMNLHNLLHFCSLRSDPHAQREIRDFSDIILHEVIQQWCPITYQAFMDYVMNAETFSAAEVEILKRKLDPYDYNTLYEMDEFTTLSKREQDEFLKKIGRVE